MSSLSTRLAVSQCPIVDASFHPMLSLSTFARAVRHALLPGLPVLQTLTSPTPALSCINPLLAIPAPILVPDIPYAPLSGLPVLQTLVSSASATPCVIPTLAILVHIGASCPLCTVAGSACPSDVDIICFCSAWCHSTAIPCAYWGKLSLMHHCNPCSHIGATCPSCTVAGSFSPSDVGVICFCNALCHSTPCYSCTLWHKLLLVHQCRVVYSASRPWLHLLLHCTS